MIFHARDQLAVRTVKAAAGGSTLKNGLIAFWEFEETSGTRQDAHTNNLDLTEFNTTSRVSGKVGFAASIAAAGNSLYLLDDPLLDFSGGMSWAFWLQYPSAVPGANAFIGSKAGEISAIYLSSTTHFSVSIVNGTTNPAIEATTFGPPTFNTWYYVVFTADNTNIKISVNAGTQDSTAQGGAISNTGNAFNVFGDSSNFSAAYMDQCGLWNRALTTSEITQLYNSGSGLAYSAM